MTVVFGSSSKVTTLYISIPEGRVWTGRVKEVDGTDSRPDDVHPGEPHEWHEMLHYGQAGTVFAECRCGAIAATYS